MTFSHKTLSVIGLAAIIVSCELPTRPPTDSSAASRLTVSPKLVTLQQNQAADFMAIGFTTAGDTASVGVSWSATSGSITDTSTSNGRHNGRYRAGADTGKVRVVAKGNPGGPADTAIVTVTLAPVTTVAVSPATASLAVGETVQLSATPQDRDGNPLSGRVVTWASTNPGVAAVSGSGRVSGVAPGAATVTAASEGQSGAMAITVTVVPVATVAVSPTSASVTIGQTVQLTATPKDANGNPLPGRTVTWATSNAAVAAVNGSGLVSGGATGTATITASSEGRNGTATITVTNVPVATVSVSPATASLQVGQTVQLTASPKDAGGNPLAGRVVTWTSSAPGVASVNGNGLVTSIAAGSATITATSEGHSGTAALTVTSPPPAPVASVTVSPATASLVVGGTQQLTATLRDASGNVLTGRVVTWATSAAAVATVNGSGLVTAGAAGSATITATSEGQSGTSAVTVTTPAPAPVASVTVSPATVNLGVAGTQQLTATLRDASGNVLTGRSVTWASSNVLVGTVSGSGLVTGLVVGSATITATSEGQNGSAALTVSVLPPQLWPNEPTGFTTVVNRPFDAVAELGWGASSLLTLVTDLTAPKSAPLVGQITFPAGFGGGYEPAATWTEGVDSRGFTRMYLSFWVKLSSNWQGHNSGVNKIGFVWMHDNPVVYFSEQGSGSGNLEAQLRLQNTPAPARNLTPNLAAVSLTRGQWHRWEVVIVANTGDQANGEAHWWIDGVKVGEYRDVLYGSSAQPKAWGGPEISWMPIWGGIGDTVAQTMYMWMDHMYISGKP
ncbi:MAG TPA: Ig-like domain-containing protein [Gemmatimonadales bacterium]|nr:Ig-like domain-containing protein [Gemmatimonadales bacterium]